MSNSEGLKVWILMHFALDEHGVPKASPIPCSSLEKLKRHAANIIEINLKAFPAEEKEKIIAHLREKNWDAVIATWRETHKELGRQELHSIHHCGPPVKQLPFNLDWDERPEIVL